MVAHSTIRLWFARALWDRTRVLLVDAGPMDGVVLRRMGRENFWAGYDGGWWKVVADSAVGGHGSSGEVFAADVAGGA